MCTRHLVESSAQPVAILLVVSFDKDDEKFFGRELHFDVEPLLMVGSVIERSFEASELAEDGEQHILVLGSQAHAPTLDADVAGHADMNFDLLHGHQRVLGATLGHTKQGRDRQAARIRYLSRPAGRNDVLPALLAHHG